MDRRPAHIAPALVPAIRRIFGRTPASSSAYNDENNISNTVIKVNSCNRLANNNIATEGLFTNHWVAHLFHSCTYSEDDDNDEDDDNTLIVCDG